MIISESKFSLAKLLAEENLIVEQRNTSTAYFNTETRVLTLPTFKEDLSTNVTDLLISHEVGHAIWTPNDEWKETIKKDRSIKSIVNVVEDARIERLIKLKYPGLRYSYSKGYKELNDSNFFGLDTMFFDEINLIDKINITCKIGFHPEIEFDTKEQYYLNKVENTKSFKDVVEVSYELLQYMKEQNEKETSHVDEYESDYDIVTAGGDGFDGGDSTEDQEFDSITQNSFDDNSFDLYSDDSKNSVYVDFRINSLDQYIVDYKTIYDRLISDLEPYKFDTDKYLSFKNEASPIVTYLIKEFWLRKNASGRKKVKISKSGDINLSKLYSYKIADDIFKRSGKIPNEQSHGLIFFLDWSGSMADNIVDTIQQLITLLLFCRKIKIPFEVYSFTSSYYDDYDLTYTEKFDGTYSNYETIMNSIRLINLFSSKMNNSEFISACNIMLSYNVVNFKTKSSTMRIPNYLSLGNTPLNKTILLSPKIVKRFVETHKIEIPNVIFLTDGESHKISYKGDGTYLPYYPYYTDLSSGRDRVYLRDKEHKITKRIRSSPHNLLHETDDCIEFVKSIYNFRMFAFRLVKANKFSSAVRASIYKSDNEKNVLSRGENCFRSFHTKYDEFYYIKSNVISKGAVIDVDENDSVSAMTRKFTKSVGGKIKNRIFLKKFIDFIG